MEKKIIKKYTDFGYVSQSGEFYLPINYAQQFVQDHCKKNLIVLGIEFFHKSNKGITPIIPINSLDCSDLLKSTESWKDIVKKTCTIACQILEQEQKNDRDQWCNFTFFDKHEWEELKKI